MSEQYDERDDYEYLDVQNPYSSTHDERAETEFETHVDVLDTRHKSQIYDSGIAEGTDGDWMASKKQVIRLTNSLDKRRQNHGTYQKSIETNKMLYNRERHKTFILGAINLVALGGCAFIWLSD